MVGSEQRRRRQKEEAEILAKLNNGEGQTMGGPESFKKKKKRTRLARCRLWIGLNWKERRVRVRPR